MWRQYFDGDNAVEAGIFGAVHLAHPSSANTREDFVRAQTFTGDDRHGLPLTSDGGEYNAVVLAKLCVFGECDRKDEETFPRFPRRMWFATPTNNRVGYFYLAEPTERAGK